jgi:ubiquinone/menaquinone biosynthesis C-methylase UbiE
MSINYLKPQNTPRLKSRGIKRQLPCSSYWSTAQEIIRKTEVYHGDCLEISSGNGFAGIAMAQITSMNIYLMESSEHTLNHVASNLKKNGLANQIRLVKGSLYQIPLADYQINLLICRKPVFFWNNQVKAFQEIYRVLAPGGAAYIGDDSWDHAKWRTIEEKLGEFEPKLSEQLNGFIWLQRMESVRQKMIQAGLTSFEMDCNDEGLRIIIRRPAQQKWCDSAHKVI